MTPQQLLIRRPAMPALRPFITEYVFSAVHEPRKSTISTMPLRYITSIDFLLGENCRITDFASGARVPLSMCAISSSTHPQEAVYSGHVVSFTIRFRPAGLFGLLGISADIFPGQCINGELLHTVIFRQIAERLTACDSIDECISIVEPCLLQLGQTAATRLYPAVAGVMAV